MRLLSPAKVNLRLEVLGKREDGYHNIFSIIQPISLYDEVSLEVGIGSEEIRVDCDHPQVPIKRDNLAYLAAEAFVQRTGFKSSIRIEIKKHIPVAGGLGGGSSNAATVLKKLNSLSEEKLSLKELQEIGRTIGADVPFFLLCKGSIAQGIGEILDEIEIPKLWYVLINPGFPLSTKEVYQNINLSLTKKGVGINIKRLERCLKTPLLVKELLYNDLEEPVLRRHPEIRDIKSLLIEKGAFGALVSGSGPTVFGLFYEKYQAKKVYELLIEDFGQKNWALFLAQGL